MRVLARAFAQLGTADLGMPAWVVEPPTHLQHLAGILANEEIAKRCVILQHDEKDIYSSPGAYQDNGSGQLQRDMDHLQQLCAQVQGQMQALSGSRAAPAPLSAAIYTACSGLLGQLNRETERWMADVEKERARIDKKMVKLDKAKAGLGGSTADLREHERLGRHTAFIKTWLGLRDEIAERHQQATSDLGTKWSTPLAPGSVFPAAGVALDAMEAALTLVRRAFDLAHVPATKVLAMCTTSIFDAKPWAVVSVFWTHDTTTAWEQKEMVMRTASSMFYTLNAPGNVASRNRLLAMQAQPSQDDRERPRQLVPVVIGADKAYFSTGDYDEDGFALNRWALYKEVELFVSKASLDGGDAKVSLKKWKKLSHFQEAAYSLMQQSNRATEPWMSDAWLSKSVDRWRDFLVRHGYSQLEVYFLGLRDLQKDGLIDPDTLRVKVRVDKVLKEGFYFALIEHSLVRLTDKPPKVQDAISMLARAGVSTTHPGGTTLLEVRLKHVQKDELRNLPEVRNAYLRYFISFYKTCFARDFSMAYSYPSFYQLAVAKEDDDGGDADLAEADSAEADLEPPCAPMWLTFDPPHACKNGRGACANRYQEWTRWLKTLPSSEQKSAEEAALNGLTAWRAWLEENSHADGPVAGVDARSDSDDEDGVDEPHAPRKGKGPPAMSLALRIALAVRRVIEHQEATQPMTPRRTISEKPSMSRGKAVGSVPL